MKQPTVAWLANGRTRAHAKNCWTPTYVEEIAVPLKTLPTVDASGVQVGMGFAVS